MDFLDDDHRPNKRSAVICVSDRDGRELLRRSLAGSYRLRFCVELKEFVSAVRATPGSVAIATVVDENGESNLSAFRQLRAARPNTIVIIYWLPTQALSRDMIEAANEGIDAVIVHRQSDILTELAQAIANSDYASATGALERELARTFAHHARDVQSMVQYCLKRDTGQMSVLRLARALHVNRRTVANRLSAENLPPAKALIMWLRVLRAAVLLTHPACTVRSAALGSGFGSASNLRSTLRRYTGLGPSDMRGRGLTSIVRSLYQQFVGSRHVSSRKEGLIARKRQSDARNRAKPERPART